MNCLRTTTQRPDDCEPQRIDTILAELLGQYRLFELGIERTVRLPENAKRPTSVSSSVATSVASLTLTRSR